MVIGASLTQVHDAAGETFSVVKIGAISAFAGILDLHEGCIFAYIADPCNLTFLASRHALDTLVLIAVEARDALARAIGIYLPVLLAHIAGVDIGAAQTSSRAGLAGIHNLHEFFHAPADIGGFVEEPMSSLVAGQASLGVVTDQTSGLFAGQADSPLLEKVWITDTSVALRMAVGSSLT